MAPPDTAALRTQYEQWRTEFKTWGRWAPVGQESKGTTNLITPLSGFLAPGQYLLVQEASGANGSPSLLKP